MRISIIRPALIRAFPKKASSSISAVYHTLNNPCPFSFVSTNHTHLARRPHSTRHHTAKFPNFKPDLFSYTSGRYLYNEKLRQKERYIEFDVEKLKVVSAKSVGREGVKHIEKLAEGGFNRVFLVTMDDGFEVIAKIPYSIALPRKLATESEVATLDFLRSKGIPVPQVYTWSSNSANDVGIEYIIMEKAAGKPLKDRWFELSPKERVNLVVSYVEIERKLFSFQFGSYGSIYYKKDLPHHLQASLYSAEMLDGDSDADRFCIGPSADYMFWNNKRDQLELNRGPWKRQQDFLYSVGQREKDWTVKFGKPRENDFPHNTLVKGEVSPELYVKLLDQYISVSPYLLPEGRDHPFNQAILRHPDLNPTNIYVSDSCQISCIIDWQHTTILPLLLSAGNPPLFENPDPEPPKNYKKPTLPENYDSLTPEEKSQADELHRRRSLFYLYMIFNGRDNEPHLNALRYPPLMLIQHLVDRAGRPWSGNIITLKGALLRLISSWDVLMANRSNKIACPVSVDPDEAKEFYTTEDSWFKVNILIEHWRSLLDDLGEDGWVRNETYEQVAETNRQLKKEWIDQAEDEEDLLCVDKHWPFQDHDELD